MKSLAVLAALLAPAVAAAAPPDEPAPWLIEEFFLARNVHPQDKGEVQVTWSLQHSGEEDVSTTNMTFEAEYGITDRLQVQAELPWQRVHPRAGDAAAGFENMEAGAQYAFARGPRRMLTVGADVELPTSGDSDADAEVEPYVIVGHSLGRGEAHASFSYGLGEDHDSAWDVAGVAPYRKWRGTLEVNGRRTGRVDSVRITPGVVWKGLRGYEVGVAVPVGVHNAPGAGIAVTIDAEF
jgi:hypothetical protein